MVSQVDPFWNLGRKSGAVEMGCLSAGTNG